MRKRGISFPFTQTCLSGPCAENKKIIYDIYIYIYMSLRRSVLDILTVKKVETDLEFIQKH